jgi:phosphotransacetylase
LALGNQKKQEDLIGCSKVNERNYFAAMMVNEGEADGLVTGYIPGSYSSVVSFHAATYR